MHDKETLKKATTSIENLSTTGPKLNKSGMKIGASRILNDRWTIELGLGIIDQRGWSQRKKRSHTKQGELKVKAMRKELKGKRSFYAAGKILHAYRSRFPNEPQLTGR
jgi:hypothetical protein